MRKSVLFAGLLIASFAASAGAQEIKEIRIATEGA